jgi:hypothetical protein
MAVPGSGELEMGSLAVEKLYDNYNSTGVISGQVSMYDLVIRRETPTDPETHMMHYKLQTVYLHFPDDSSPSCFLRVVFLRSRCKQRSGSSEAGLLAEQLYWSGICATLVQTL